MTQTRARWKADYQGLIISYRHPTHSEVWHDFGGRMGVGDAQGHPGPETHKVPTRGRRCPPGRGSSSAAAPPVTWHNSKGNMKCPWCLGLGRIGAGEAQVSPHHHPTSPPLPQKRLRYPADPGPPGAPQRSPSCHSHSGDGASPSWGHRGKSENLNFRVLGF